MRPRKYPYSNPQWEKQVNNVYCDSSSEKPIAQFVTYINKLTGEIK